MRLSMIWGTDYADQGGCYPPKTSVALFLSSILLLRSLEPRIWLFPFRNACKNIPPKQLSSCALSDSDDLGQFLAGSVWIARAFVPPGSIFQFVCSRLQRDFKLLLNLETLHLSDCVLIMISRFIFLKIVFFICCISLSFPVKLASVVAENNRKNDGSSHFLQLYPPE